jgi:hypothetical protein
VGVVLHGSCHEGGIAGGAWGVVWGWRRK